MPTVPPTTFEFLESYFDGDVDIVGEHGPRKLVNIGNAGRSHKDFGETTAVRHHPRGSL